MEGWSEEEGGRGRLQRAGGQLVGRFQPEEKQEEVDRQETEREESRAAHPLLASDRSFTPATEMA